MSAQSSTSDGWLSRNWWVVLSLAAILILAIFVRVAFNLPIFVEHGLELAGNDPYYHRRTISNIVETGHHFFEDPMIDYPDGGRNVNPPTFDWSVALLSVMLGPFVGGAQVALDWVLAASPVLWGALTIVAVYLVTADTFDRKSGLIAALLMALMASHIERSMFAFADHDSFVLFWITLGMFFYLRSVARIDRREWIGSWGNPSDVGRGIRTFVDENHLGLAYAGLAGLSFANVALAWKGFHYAVAIVFAYAVVQLILDHLRRESGLDVALVTIVTMGIVVALAAPWYSWASMWTWFEPTLFILTGFLFVCAFLVPTRDLPSILVIPAFVGFIVLGLAVVQFAFPEIAKVLFGGFSYFQQSRVYQTIAEAHPADFSLLVFNFGVATFYMALVGLVLLALRIRKDLTKAKLFMLVWAAVAIYMGIAAMRFLFNASPVFAVMAGWMTWYVLDRLDYQGMAKRLRGYGRDPLDGIRKSVGISHVAGVLFLAFAIVVPNTYFAIDAGMPSEYESDLARNNPGMEEFVRQNMGTFGQGYLPSYWRGGLQFLSQQDTHLPPPDRPAFLSWWDYGFWAAEIGEHPTVADNFQNNFFFAGRFLASQNETHGIQIMVAGFMRHRVVPKATMADLVRDVGVEERNVSRVIESLAAFEYSRHLDRDQTVELYRKVTERSGKIVRYAAIDQRLFPFDNPQTPRIDFNSIFYAPMTLAQVNPSSYVEIVYTVQEVPAAPGGGQTGQPRTYQVTEEQLQQLQNDPTRNVQVQGQSYRYKQPFFNSMVYRIYVGTPPRGQPPGDGRLLPGQTQPCFGMEHFRVVYQNSGLRICKFYFGANVSGRVTLANGDPVPRTTVSALDPFGIPHGSAVTDRGGNFTIGAPFGEIRLVAFRGRGQNQVTLGVSDPFNVTDEQAMTGADISGINITVEPGNVTGTVFWDEDGDGEWNPANDTALEDATVLVNRRFGTSDAEGRYNVSGVAPGPARIQAQKEGYRAQPSTATVRGGNTTVHNVSMTLAPVPVSGTTYRDEDGDGTADPGEEIANATIEFAAEPGDETAEDTSTQANATGGYSAQLKPGNYSYTATATVGGTSYSGSGTITVPFGGDPIVLDIAMEATVG